MSGRPQRLVCLFAQYHPRNRIPPLVLAYLRALRDCGFEVHVAASGTTPPPDADQAALAETGATLTCRDNAGLDFGAWQHLIRDGRADGADAVLLANDSVFGPFTPLAPIIDRMNEAGHDAWGMIESRQRGWHLQSWFLHLSGDAFRHKEVAAVFAQDFAAMSKGEVIAHGELSLGAALQRAGLRCGAYVPFRDSALFPRRFRLNMMHLDWRHNVRTLGLPFVKAELLRQNPMRLPWAPAWVEELRAAGADVDAISAHLYDYTGTTPERPGAPFPTPVRPLSIRLLLGYLRMTHDRALALRWIRPANLRLSLGPTGLSTP